MGQDHDNPTVRSAEEATGMSPLNAQPSEPQPPQHGSFLADPTMDTLPPSLTNLPSPIQAFVLALDTRDTRDKNAESIDPSKYPDASKFEDLVKKGLRPEGPARAQDVPLEQVQWPAGFEAIKQIVAENGEGLKAFEVVQGVKKADVFVVAVDLDNDRLVGVRFPKQE
ncbi:hypothetical protein Q7P37_004999 [Cladosporium fusiforme]